MTDASRDLAARITRTARDARPPGRFRLGQVSEITERAGRPRIYVVDARPMAMVGYPDEAGEVTRGSFVLFWDGDPPFIIGPLVSD